MQRKAKSFVINYRGNLRERETKAKESRLNIISICLCVSISWRYFGRGGDLGLEVLLLVSDSKGTVVFVNVHSIKVLCRCRPFKQKLQVRHFLYSPLFSLLYKHCSVFVLCRNYGSRVAAWLVLNSDLLVSEDDLRDRDRLIEATDHGLNNHKCRLYWCSVEFIDWRFSQSCWYFRPALWTIAPLTFSLVNSPPSLCVRGGGGVWAMGP